MVAVARDQAGVSWEWVCEAALGDVRAGGGHGQCRLNPLAQCVVEVA